MAERGQTGEVEVAGSLSAFSVRVGDCMDDWDVPAEGGEVRYLDAIPCGDAHDNEVYAIFDLRESGWPGDERVYELAEQGCLDLFRSAIGVPYSESVLDITWFVPTEYSWTSMDDREVVCLAYHMEGEKLYRSVLNSGI